MCLRNALNKSCIHSMSDSFIRQMDRLQLAGYPKQLLSSVVESFLQKLKRNTQDSPSVSERNRNEKITVIPYMHRIAHNLKKTGKRANVKVVLSAPNKLSAMCSRVNKTTRTPQSCSTNHVNQFVNCTEGVVYSVPLSCGKTYVGLTGRCLNERLKEHNYNVHKAISGHLGVHCRDCGCAPIFSNTIVIAKNKQKTTREIIEAAEIVRLKDKCVSKTSLTLSQKEIQFLNPS